MTDSQHLQRLTLADAIARAAAESRAAPPNIAEEKRARTAHSEILGLPELLMPQLQDPATGAFAFMLDYDPLP